MAHNKDFGANEEAINQTQSDLVAKEPQRRKLKITLTGSPEVVTSTIHSLHLRGYAPVGDWSTLLPTRENPEEVMSILVRYITIRFR